MTTYLNTVVVKTEVLGGKIDRVKAPMVLGGCVCGGACFFDGYLDTVSCPYYTNNCNICNYILYIYIINIIFIFDRKF